MAMASTVTITLNEYDHLRKVEKDFNAYIKGSHVLVNNPVTDGNGFIIHSAKDIKQQIVEDVKRKNIELRKRVVELEEALMEASKIKTLFEDRVSAVNDRLNRNLFDEFRKIEKSFSEAIRFAGQHLDLVEKKRRKR